MGITLVSPLGGAHNFATRPVENYSCQQEDATSPQAVWGLRRGAEGWNERYKNTQLWKNSNNFYSLVRCDCLKQLEHISSNHNCCNSLIVLLYPCIKVAAAPLYTLQMSARGTAGVSVPFTITRVRVLRWSTACWTGPCSCWRWSQLVGTVTTSRLRTVRRTN